MMVGQAFPYPRRSIHTSTGDIRLYRNRERYWTELCFSARKRCETRFFNHYFYYYLNSVLSGSRSGGSLFAVAGATGGSGSRFRTSESFDPKHKNIDH